MNILILFANHPFLLIAILIDLYSLLIYTKNYIKKTSSSGLILAATFFYLYQIIYSFNKGEITLFTMMIFIIILAISRILLYFLEKVTTKNQE